MKVCLLIVKDSILYSHVVLSLDIPTFTSGAGFTVAVFLSSFGHHVARSGYLTLSETNGRGNMSRNFLD